MGGPRIVAVWLALLALAGAGARAADYHVAPGGDDGADGLTPGTAWETLVHAAGQVGPGDTVHVADGAYQGFHLETSGAPGDPITFLAEGADVRITADNPTTPDGINLEGASHVVIDGFVVDGRTRAGIRAVLASHVTVRNCRMGGNGRWGLLTGFVDDLLAEDNEAHHSQEEHGIYVSNSADRPVVRRNHLHDNHANGLHMNGDASLGGDGLIEDALVEGNVIHGNGVGGGSGINVDGGVRAVIRNNLLYDNHASGVSLYRIDGGAPSTDNVVVNNTIVNASDGRWCVNIRDGSTGNTVRNNILWNEHAFRGALSVAADSLAGLDSDFNSLIGRITTDDGNSVLDLATWQAQGHDAASFEATPAEHFLAPGSDFRLLASSPAVDAGSASDAPADDLLGAPRPAGSGYDLGAYELQLLSCGDGVLDPGEACEAEGDCAAGETCQGCGCIAPPLCAGGVPLEKPRLKLRADGRFSFQARVRLDPAAAPDPAADGVRIVTGPLDATAPGGPSWTAKGRGWKYRDVAAAPGPIGKGSWKAKRTPGLYTVKLRGEAAPWALPSPAGLETTLLAPGGECAVVPWNPPGGAKPRCKATPEKLRCR